MRRRRFLQLAASAALVPGPARAEVVWQGTALGADCRLSLRGDRAEAERTLAAVPPLLAAIEADFSLFRPDSALSRLNATGRLDAPSAAFSAVMALADRVHTATAGAFDPSVQALWQRLARGLPVQGAPVGWARVGLDPPRLPPGMALTFIGIAQGFATDAVTRLLRDRGFAQVLVEMGETAAIGGPFRLGLQDPAAGLVGRLTLRDGAVATSSPLATLVGGQPHIQHPQGRPPLWSTVSVRSRDAALADALSTALVFLSAEEIRAVDLGVPLAVQTVDFAGNLALLRADSGA